MHVSTARDEELTLHAVHWNKKKIGCLPSLMVKWYDKVCNHLFYIVVASRDYDSGLLLAVYL